LTSFTDFGLSEPITRALTEEKYVTPTPIQAAAIPVLMTGRDLIGIAQTGTGKTASFALPILHRLSVEPKRREPLSARVLVLTPTRELAAQIVQSFFAYGKHLRINAALAIGGVPIGRQVRALQQGVDILVATPGRLVDLMRSNAVRLDKIEFLVLDEADRMLDMGFIQPIRLIVSKLPKARQSLFFSATMPPPIAELAAQMLRDPATVAVTPVSSTAERIAQRIIHIDRGGKQGLLADLLKRETINRALVFTRTKHGADKVVRGLVKLGIAAEAIHGNKSQSQRERVMAAFRSGQIRTLVATDIAARGIDVDGISHVFNFDLPNEPESYVHRIGRTARAGAEGVAISFCDGEERGYLRDIEKLIRASIPSEGEPQKQVAPSKPHGHKHGQPSRGRHSQGRDNKSYGGHHAGGHKGGQNGHRRSAAPHQGGNKDSVGGAKGIGDVAFLNAR